MAANIDQMAYTGATPWHQLGQKVEGEAMTAAVALSKGGLDFVLEKRPLWTRSDDNQDIEVPDQFAIVRTDRQHVLGVVGKKYHIVQNYDAFRFFDTIVGENAACYHTVGSLGRGEKIWILAKLPNDIVVERKGRDADITEQYLLLTTAHDGSSAVTAKFTPVRVVCQNTLSAALIGGVEVSIRHTKKADDRLKDAHKLMGIVQKQVEETQAVYNQMAQKIVATDAVVNEYLNRVFPVNEEAKNQTRRNNIIIDVKNRYRSGMGNTGSTLWDLYNGVTEYVDHGRSSKGKTDETRWESAYFGTGSKIKEQAMKAALAVLGN